MPTHKLSKFRDIKQYCIKIFFHKCAILAHFYYFSQTVVSITFPRQLCAILAHFLRFLDFFRNLIFIS